MIYTKYNPEFKLRIPKNIVVDSYGTVNLRMSNYQNKINILIVINLSWALELEHYLLSIKLLAKKCIKLFLKIFGGLSEILIDKKIFGLADINEN